MINIGPKKDNEIKDRSNNFPIEKSMVANIENNPPFSDGKKEPKRMEANTCNVPPPKVKENDEILCCDGCGCYGMSGEFLNSQACSMACQVHKIVNDNLRLFQSLYYISDLHMLNSYDDNEF